MLLFFFLNNLTTAMWLKNAEYIEHVEQTFKASVVYFIEMIQFKILMFLGQEFLTEFT